jgi:epoxyqueuosine reductase
VKSGLGRYGRNNICYVGDMGTCITLLAYFTDYEFPEDHWGEMKMLDQCEKCRVCIEHCPTKAIREDDFVIDVARCVTLYNEIEGDFPDWIEPSAHNALVGCMHCQFKCPANRLALQHVGRLADVTEDETIQILSGHPEDSVREAVYAKLRKFGPAGSQEGMPLFVRNLSVLLER